MASRVKLGVIAIISVLIATILFFRSRQIIKVEIKNLDLLRPKTQNPLDGCLHVFLDVGSNRGIQTRKLYEPHLFPNAGLLKIFNEYFGDFSSRNLSEICAVGFEPNPVHEEQLKKTAAAYQKCGWKVFFHTKTGVAKEDSMMKYAKIEKINGVHWGMDVAGRLIENDADFGEELNKNINKKIDNIASVRLSRYLLEVVDRRALPLTSLTSRPKVVMKLDIEGRELEVIPDLVMAGALATLDEIHVDWTRKDPYVDTKATASLNKAMALISELASKAGLEHQCNVEARDDESYGEFDGPFPKC